MVVAVASAANPTVVPEVVPLELSFCITISPVFAVDFDRTISAPLLLVSFKPLPAEFTTATTPVYDVWSLMAAAAADRPSTAWKFDTAKFTEVAELVLEAILKL